MHFLASLLDDLYLDVRERLSPASRAAEPSLAPWHEQLLYIFHLFYGLGDLHHLTALLVRYPRPLSGSSC